MEVNISRFSNLNYKGLQKNGKKYAEKRAFLGAKVFGREKQVKFLVKSPDFVSIIQKG